MFLWLVINSAEGKGENYLLLKTGSLPNAI